MTREEILEIITEVTRELPAVIFTGNGCNARSLCAIDDRPEFFYMVGSMGLCPTVAAGFVHFANRLPVIVIEGDGNALMGLSGFPVVAHAAKNYCYVHIVLNNGVYETTGGQSTLAPFVDFANVASGVGYAESYNCVQLSEFKLTLQKALTNKHSTFIHIATKPFVNKMRPRPPYHPRQIKQRFREAVSSLLE